MFYSYGEGNAYEYTNGKEIKINGSRNFDKDNIKFVSYSNKIKPEIQKVFDELECKRIHSNEKFFKVLCNCNW
jgi:3'(2'), 5'-bisphosphate nucleotidase